MKRLRIISTFLLVAALLVTSIQPVNVYADEPVDEVGYADPEEPVSVDNMGENVENEETGTEEGLAEETLGEVEDAAAGSEEEPVTEPVAEPVTEPVVESVAEPVAEFASEPEEGQETETVSGSDEASSSADISSNSEDNTATASGTDTDKNGTDTSTNTADNKASSGTDDTNPVEKGQADPDTITAIDSPDTSELYYDYKLGLDRLLEDFPKSLVVYRGDESEKIDANWICEDDYDEALGEYTFRPDLEGYKVADDVEIPQITVIFGEELVDEVDGYVQGEPAYEIPSVSSRRTRKSTIALPSAYNLFDDNKLPAIKSQSPWGTCWTFSAIGSIEADLRTDNPSNSMDLSEFHTAYFMSHYYDDPKNCYTGRIELADSNPDKYLSSGGNVESAARLYSSLVGIVSESDAPYLRNSSEAEAFNPDSSYVSSKNVARMTNAYFINTNDRDDIKNAIMEHGGVSASYYDSNSYFSASGTSYYYNGGESPNHAIMLVGWDDSFSKNKFKTTPSGNGAWLVRNSWGVNDYSHFGYFWLSYYDSGLMRSEGVTAFDTSTELYDNCYAYECMPNCVGSISFGSSNATETVNYAVAGGEDIQAVSFEIGTANVNAVITLTNKDTTESVTKSIDTTYAGIYTAVLDEPFEVAADSEVEVKIEYTSRNNDELNIPVEMKSETSIPFYLEDGVLYLNKFYPECDNGFTLNGYKYQYDPLVKLYTNDNSSSGEVSDYHVESVTLNRTNASVAINSQITLRATVYPLKAADRSVTWSSSNESVATVTNSGAVTGVSPGTADITVTTNDGGKTATCRVTVSDVPVEGVYISSAYSNLYVGQSGTFKATVYPDDASDKSVTWSSSAPDIASVTDEGVVTGLKPGTADITVETNDGGFTSTYTTTIISIPVSSVSINYSRKSITVGETFTLTAYVYPSNATDKTVTWSSNNTEIVTVTDEGVIEGISPGTATVSATSNDGGYTGTCVVIVNPVYVSGVEIKPSSAEIIVGEEFALSANILPENATNKGVTWKSNRTGVATVSSEGVVKGIKPGTATITVETNDGWWTDSCTVTVKPKPVQSVELEPETTEILTGETVLLSATVYPEDAGNKSVTWISSDESVATVSATGSVTGIKPGEAIITVTTVDGEKTANCVVTVLPVPVSGLSVDPKSAEILINRTVTLTPVIVPEDAANKSVIWTSSDQEVATVSDDGVVTGLTPGTAEITVTTVDGGFSDTSTITVIPVAVTGVEVTPLMLDVIIGDTAELTANILPADATDRSVIWSSDDGGIATVTAEGVVTGIKVGTTDITATANNGKSAKCKVNVKPVPVSGVVLDKTTADVFAGDTVTLKETVSPENAGDKTVTWSSSDTTVATVSDKGVVTGIKPGEATITVKTNNKGKTATCKVTVKPVAVTGVVITPATQEVLAGRTLTVTPVISPGNATDKAVTWTSSDTAIATVTDAGVVKGVAPGEATVTVTTKDGAKKATCKITVKPVAVTGLALDRTTGSVSVGNTLTLKATVSPSDATEKGVNWESDTPAVATVTEAGVVKGISAGTANITATTVDGGKIAICKVTVNPVKVSSIKLNTTAGEVVVGKTFTLSATVSPSNASNKELSWKSSDTSVATVENGVVKGVKAGTVTITCSSTDGSNKAATCKVTVKAIAVTGVKLNKTSVSIFKGRTYTLTPTISPSDATNKKIKWKSSDTSVATVGSDGVVTGIKAGKATITCTAADGSKKSATCNITVKTPVSSIKLNKTSVGIFKGKTYTLTATVSPSNATKKTVTWSSSDTSIATVTADGVVKGVKAGKATITCTAADGSKVSSTCKVTVKIPVSAISLNKTSVKINKGKTYTLTPTISPSSASNKNVTWTSSNTKIATVSADGVVKGLRAGTATITCTAADGTKKSATCSVTVKIPVTGVTLNKSRVSVSKGKTVTLTATVEPSNATTKGVTWSSSNTRVATVSSSGVVKGIKKGTATITVTTKDGKKTATCKVTVK